MAVIAIVGGQWGDEGKGKIIDASSERENINIVVRFNGGHNAGHMVENEFGSLGLHLVPSGISYGDKVTNIIANGVAVRLDVLKPEILDLIRKGIKVTPQNLILSLRAQLNPPYYDEIERIKEEIRGTVLGKKIGTTGRGIGVVYTHKADRTGIRVIDLLDDEGKTFKSNVKMHVLQYGLKDVDPDKLFDQQRILLNELKKYLKLEDTVDFFRRNSGANILLEGAQGNLLDPDGGTVPYVTSSNPIPGGAYIGALGIPRIDRVICVMKCGYMTRVGSGPFPTELGGKESEEYCDDKSHTLKHELELYGIPFDIDADKIKYNHNHQKIIKLMLDKDPFLRGVGIRFAGNEFGVSTGRPRRCGDQDGVAGRYSINISRGAADKIEIALTKGDVLDGMPRTRFCIGYNINGNETSIFPIDEHTLYEVEPVYQTYSGWDGTRGIRTYDKMPDSFKNYVKAIEDYHGVPVSIISNGPGRKDIIFR